MQSKHSVLEAGAKITLWHEGNPLTSNDSGPSSAKETKQFATDGEPLPAKKVKQLVTGTSKRESFEEEIDLIFAELKEKHTSSETSLVGRDSKLLTYLG